MKRVLSLILALVMLLAMFTMVGATEGPDGAESTEAPVEPAPAAELTEEPAEPAPEVTETVTEPAAEPTVEPAADPTDEPAAEPTEEPSAEPTAEPVVEPTEAPVEPTAEPVVEPVAAPPADNGLEPASLPDLTQVTEQPAPTPDHRTVRLYANGGYFTGDHAGYDGFLKALNKDGTLPKTDGVGYPGDPNWYTPERPGYKFAGWYKGKDEADARTGDALKEGSEVPEDVPDLYAGWMRMLTLDAEPGSFTGGEDNYVRTVEVPDGKMPAVADVPVFDIDNKDAENVNVEFKGWYTEKSKVVTGDGKDYTTWSVKPQGKPVTQGEALGEGITTLYAGYESKNETKRVTFYLDWNGINGMWGECLTVSRSYDEGVNGYALTYKDLLVLHLNWDDVTRTFNSMDEVKQYWQEKNGEGGFNGYEFLGWAQSPDAESPDVDENTVIANGESIYAVWTKDGESNKTFVENNGREKDVGPLQFIQFESLKNSAHGTKGATATVTMHTSPVDAELEDVVWKVTYSVPNTKADSAFAPPEAFTVTVKDGATFDGKNPGEGNAEVGITATANGRTLTVTDVDGKDYGITITVSAATKDEKIEGGRVESNTYAEISFSHDWQPDPAKEEVKATCTTNGWKYYKCSACEEEKEVKTPVLGHVFDFRVIEEASCTENGIYGKACMRPDCDETYLDYMRDMGFKTTYENEPIPPKGHTFKKIGTEGTNGKGVAIIKEECDSCHDQDTVLCGDVSGDSNISVSDVLLMCQHIQHVDNGKKIDVAAGDINGDSNISVSDVLLACQYIQGVKNTLG